MTSPHSTPSELLDLHFGEGTDGRQAGTAAHVAVCPRCREELANVEWVERSLAALPEEEPPADGLDRVMGRVGRERLARERGAGWLAPLAASLGGVAGGVAIIYAVGAWLLGLPELTEWPMIESARALSGFGLATLAFFTAGSFATLALAPALLIEAQSRARALAAR